MTQDRTTNDTSTNDMSIHDPSTHDRATHDRATHDPASHDPATQDPATQDRWPSNTSPQNTSPQHMSPQHMAPQHMAPPDVWAAVDEYLTDLLVGSDPALDAALAASAAAGLPPIQVSAPQGKLLHLLARTQGARTILELGTLGGYSAIWLGRALPPDGRLITLEAEPRHAEIARTNIARAGLSAVVEVRLGPALDTLPRLVADGSGPFDLIFIDADKPAYPEYLTWALALSRPGTLIVADNVVRRGAVADPTSTDANVLGVRRFTEQLAAEPRVTATTIQTVGSKGYDGLAFGLVTG